MARPQGVSGGRPHIVPTRLSAGELAALDEARGSLGRGEFVRWALLELIRKTESPSESVAHLLSEG